MNINSIKSYYNNNKAPLHNLYSSLEATLSGRICHPSILLLKIVTELVEIENYLEIGVHNGGSVALLLTNPNIKKIYGIDLFEDIYNRRKHLNSTKFETYRYFTKDNLSIKKTSNSLKLINKEYGFNPSINLIQGNSYYDETEEKLKVQLGGVLMDLIHIDGDHTGDGVQNDFERFFKYLKPGGFLSFDDYHHPLVKDFVDSRSDANVRRIGKFACDNTEGTQFLIQKTI